MTTPSANPASITLAAALSKLHNGEGEPFVTLRESEAAAANALHLEMLQLLANALSDSEGWSARDEARAAEIMRTHL